MAAKRGRGRPRKGPQDTRVRDLPQRTLRWPALTEARLQAWALMTGRPAWQLVSDAVNATIDALPADQRRAIDTVARARVKHLAVKD